MWQINNFKSICVFNIPENFKAFPCPKYFQQFASPFISRSFFHFLFLITRKFFIIQFNYSWNLLVLKRILLTRLVQCGWEIYTFFTYFTSEKYLVLVGPSV